MKKQALTPESKQVKRLRSKLQKRLEEEKQQLTPDALRQCAMRNLMWLERHAEEKASLKNKNIKLFDENTHTAHVKSHYIRLLQQRIRNE